MNLLLEAVRGITRGRLALACSKESIAVQLKEAIMAALNSMFGVEKEWDVDPEGRLGFVDTKSGVIITDPTRSTCGRFAVAPEVEYDMEESAAVELARLNGHIGMES